MYLYLAMFGGFLFGSVMLVDCSVDADVVLDGVVDVPLFGNQFLEDGDYRFLGDGPEGLIVDALTKRFDGVGDFFVTVAVFTHVCVWLGK